MCLVAEHGTVRGRWKMRDIKLFMWIVCANWGIQTECLKKKCYFDADGNRNPNLRKNSVHTIKSPAGIFPFLLLLCSTGTQQKEPEPVRKSWQPVRLPWKGPPHVWLTLWAYEGFHSLKGLLSDNKPSPHGWERLLSFQSGICSCWSFKSLVVRAPPLSCTSWHHFNYLRKFCPSLAPPCWV